MSEKFSIKKMPKPQRYSFYFLIFLTIGIFSLWIWQFNYNLNSKFYYNSQTEEKEENEITRPDTSILDNFQNFDDLTQLEEGNISSPVVSQDNEAIIYDPDQDPHAWSSSDLSSFKEFEEQLQLLESQLLLDEQLLAENEDDFYLSLLSGEGDPESLRQLLLLTGLEEEMINQLSDEELMEIYQEILLEY